MADSKGTGLAAVQLSHSVVADAWSTQADSDLLANNNYPSQELKGLSLQTPDLTIDEKIQSVTTRLQLQIAKGDVDATVTFYRAGTFKLNAPIVVEATDSTQEAAATE
ncbi:hypothetical protein [Pseudomonas sp. JZ134]|uniref:hypothetical protein n=1 Tax=Pseudomonas sp. JZ134 TaxID=2806615 RepID=UPI003D9FD46A